MREVSFDLAFIILPFSDIGPNVCGDFLIATQLVFTSGRTSSGKSELVGPTQVKF